MGDEVDDYINYHRMRPDLHAELLKPPEGCGDISNSTGGPGAEMAALFLHHFILSTCPNATWLHYDVNGKNVAAKPGRPAGGEAMGMRSAYRFLEQKLGL